MDVWERCVRRAMINGDDLRILLLNMNSKERETASFRLYLRDLRRSDSVTRLLRLLLKLNSRNSEALRWASGLTRGLDDVA